MHAARVSGGSGEDTDKEPRLVHCIPSLVPDFAQCQFRISIHLSTAVHWVYVDVLTFF